MEKTLMVLMLLVLSLTGLTAVSAIDIPDNRFQIRVDDYTLQPNDVNRVDVMRNQKHNVDVRFIPTTDMRDVELEIFVSGFEHNDLYPIRDKAEIFNAEANVTYTKYMSFTLTDEVEEDDYKLRVILSDRNGVEFVRNYNLKFDVPRHSLKIEDVVMSPKGAIKAGQALLTQIRIENKGEMKESDVKVELVIPSLNLTAVEYIDEIRIGKEEMTEEIFMKIPSCVKAGEYDMNINVLYNNLHTGTQAKAKVLILAGECLTGTTSRVTTANQANSNTVILVTPTQPNLSNRVTVQTPEETVDAESSPLLTIRRVLEIVLIALIILLAVVGITFYTKNWMATK